MMWISVPERLHCPSGMLLNHEGLSSWGKEVSLGHDAESQALAQRVSLHVQGGKITFVYIASPEEDGDDLETGESQTLTATGLTCASKPPGSICECLKDSQWGHSP